MTNISSIKKQPLFKKIDLRGLRLADFTDAIRTRRQHMNKLNPEKSVFEFYLASLILEELENKNGKHTPLKGKQLDLALRALNLKQNIFKYMLYYLYVICVREARHVKGFSLGGSFYSNVRDIAGHEATNFLYNNRGGEPESIMERAIQYNKDGTLAGLMEGIHYIFLNGEWSGGYGGTPWADIADKVCKYLNGEISGAIMTDLAFALSHNNGPIFNKDIFFQGYSHHLLGILDVQRAGQLPNLIGEGMFKYFSADWTPKSLIALMHEAGVMTGPFDPVDWDLVQETGVSELLFDYAGKSSAKKKKKKPVMQVNLPTPKKDKGLFDQIFTDGALEESEAPKAPVFYIPHFGNMAIIEMERG